MKLFNVTANTAAIASLISLGVEGAEAGARNASQAAKTAVAVNDIKNYTGDSVLNKSSEKHNAMKEIVRNSDAMTIFHKIGGATTGFVKGFVEGSKGNLPTLGFSVLTLACKNKVLKTIGVAGMGISMLWDFLANGTNLFTDRNGIEK